MQNAGGFAAPFRKGSPWPSLWRAWGPWREPLPGAISASSQLGVGSMVPAWPGCCPQAGHRPWGPLPFPTLRCAPGEDGTGLVSQLCHHSVSQGESESLRAEPSPSGVTPLPLPFLPPSRVFRAGASPDMGHAAQLPASLDVPHRCTAMEGGEWDVAPHPTGETEPQPCSQAQQGEGRMVPYLQK